MDTNTVIAVQQMLTDHPELQSVVQRHAPAFALGIAWGMRELHLMWNYWPDICAYCESRDGGLVPTAYRKLFGKPISPAIKP